jgi:hypothetical protein
MSEETTKTTRKAPAKPRKTAAKAKPVTTETIETTPVAVSHDKPVAVAHSKPSAVSHEEIRQLAHKYWIEGGHRQGHQHEDWARAEADLRRRAS